MVRSVFFYGLFMDPAVRAARGAPGGGPDRPALLTGWRMIMGERSSLVPAEAGEVWGTVADLDDAQLGALYAELPNYAPVPVRTLVDGAPVSAAAWVAPADAIGEPDRDYALELAQLCRTLGLPESYAAAVEAAGGEVAP